MRVLAGAVSAVARADGPSRWLAEPHRGRHRHRGLRLRGVRLPAYPRAPGCARRRRRGRSRCHGRTRAEIGDRFGDADLRAFATLGHGQALIAMGETVAGTARLDDVMVSVTSGEVGPITSGIVYCAVLLECMRVFDLSRASEWTNALSAWCDEQPDLVPYRGQCLVHRAQLEQAAGKWRDAIVTIESACRRLTDPPHPALGLAYYQAAELDRLTGSFDNAETEYRHANRHGYPPMPGLALLELARGDAATATTTIRRALQDVDGPIEQPALLAAAVEISRATGDVLGTRAAADELVDIAAGSSSALLTAMADQAVGAALLSEGAASDALTHLRAAVATWLRLNIPYERARTAVLIGLACAALGDLSLGRARVRQRTRHVRRARRRSRSRSLEFAHGRPSSTRPLDRRGQACAGAVGSRARSVGAGCCREDQPGDRDRARHQPTHRWPAPREHLREARRDEPSRGDRDRVRERPPLKSASAAMGHSPHRS